MADEELSAPRMGVDRGEAEFELMMAAIRGDVCGKQNVNKAARCI